MLLDPTRRSLPQWMIRYLAARRNLPVLPGGAASAAQEHLGQFQVVGGGDFDVVDRAGHGGDAFSESFDRLGVVGDVGVGEGGIGPADEVRPEDLGSLGLAEVFIQLLCSAISCFSID